MPKVKYLGTDKRDFLRELVLGRKTAKGLTRAELADKAKMSEFQVQRLLAKPSDEWDIGVTKRLCRALDIPLDEMRFAIKY